MEPLHFPLPQINLSPANQLKLNDFSRAHAREKSSSEQTCNHNQRLLKFKCGLTMLDSP